MKVSTTLRFAFAAKALYAVWRTWQWKCCFERLKGATIHYAQTFNSTIADGQCGKNKKEMHCTNVLHHRALSAAVIF